MASLAVISRPYAREIRARRRSLSGQNKVGRFRHLGKRLWADVRRKQSARAVANSGYDGLRYRLACHEGSRRSVFQRSKRAGVSLTYGIGGHFLFRAVRGEIIWQGTVDAAGGCGSVAKS